MSKIDKYNILIENIVFEFTKKLYKEEKVLEELEKQSYYITKYKGILQGPCGIGDNFLNLEDILICQANDLSAKKLIEYNDLCLEAHNEGKNIGVNYYNFAKFGIKGKVYTEIELKESALKVRSAEKELFDIINEKGLK